MLFNHFRDFIGNGSYIAAYGVIEHIRVVVHAFLKEEHVGSQLHRFADAFKGYRTGELLTPFDSSNKSRVDIQFFS